MRLSWKCLGGLCLLWSPHSGFPETPSQRCAAWEGLLEESSSRAAEEEGLAARGWELSRVSFLPPQRGPGLQLDEGDSHRLSWVVGLSGLGDLGHAVQGERWVLVGSWAKDQQEERQVLGVGVGDDVGTPWRWVR